MSDWTNLSKAESDPDWKPSPEEVEAYEATDTLYKKLCDAYDTLIVNEVCPMRAQTLKSLANYMAEDFK